MLGMKISLAAAALALGLGFSPDIAMAQNCRAMPIGPDRMACMQQFHPDIIEARYARCAKLADDRGFGTPVHHDPKKGFMRRCMRGEQS